MQQQTNKQTLLGSIAAPHTQADSDDDVLSHPVDEGGAFGSTFLLF